MSLTTRFVGPVGPENAKMLFIDQAPGVEEDSFGQPLVGSAAQFVLNPALKETNILRSEILIWSVFHKRPPHNEVGYYYQDKNCTKLTWEGQEHVDELRRWLQTLLACRETGRGGPNVIVALGREALQELTGQNQITKWRGSVLPCTLVPGFKIYPTFRPAYVLRLMNEPEEKLQGVKKAMKQNALPLFLRDLERARMQSEFPEIRAPQRDLRINASFDEMIEFTRAARKVEAVACDIETIPTPSGPIVWCVGFSPRPNFAWTIPLIRRGSQCWSMHEEKILWVEISQLFLDLGVLKIFQNGGYDMSILGRYYGLRVPRECYGDIMWCFQARHPYLLKRLAVLVSYYTWEPFYKDEGKVWGGRRTTDEAEFFYNCKDAACTREIWPIVTQDCRQADSWQTYSNHMRNFTSLLRMQTRGVVFDTPRKLALQEKWTADCAAIEQRIKARLSEEML